MNSLYIMSKPSKVVDVSVCHSCCSLDLKAGEKSGWRKITCAQTWDSQLHFCMLLFILCVCFAPLWHSVNQSESVGALRSLAVLGRACARARQMRCIC